MAAPGDNWSDDGDHQEPSFDEDHDDSEEEEEDHLQFNGTEPADHDNCECDDSK